MCTQKIFPPKKNNEQKKMSFKRMVTSGRGGGVRKKRRFIGPRQFIGPRRAPPGFSMRRFLNQRTGGFQALENKFFDVESVGDGFTATWATMEPATTNLTAIAQGDSESNRDGRKYSINSIHIKGFVVDTVVESGTAPVQDRYVRICLVHDTQTNGAQLSATDVMDGGQTNDELAFRNLQFTKRFKILMDKSFVIPTSRASMNEGAINLFAHAGPKVRFSFNKKFKVPIPVTMSGTTADIANVTDNSIHMIGVGDTTTTQLTYQCRIRFSG